MTDGRLRAVVSAWTLLGVAALFATSIVRLGSRGIATIQRGLEWGEWSGLIFLTVAFVYGEGFRALDRRWVPRLLERALLLRDDPRLSVRLLAPLYGLALVGVGRGDLIRGWLVVAAILGAVLTVRVLPDPWRGIIDFAVAAALSWGLVAILRRVPEAGSVATVSPDTILFQHARTYESVMDHE
jgi:hypothetical protein